MKRLLLLILFITACGGSEVVEEPVTTTTTVEIVTNTTLEQASTTTTLDPLSIFNCDPDPTVPECSYEYNPTTELFWSSASMFYAIEYEKLWNLYVERYRNKDIEVPPEIANIFDQPVFTIEVDDKTLNCFYHMPHNSQYWNTDGIYPQPVETVTEDENYLVWPKIYWDCLDVPLSLRYGNYSTDDNWNLVNTDVMYFGQGPIVLLGDIGNRAPDFRYGTWIMWGPEQPFGENSSDKPRQFEVRDKYWWYEDGFSVESFCNDTTFTYQEDYEILCLNEVERSDILLANFAASWKAKMKEDILLSDSEKKVNEKFAELWAWAGSKWEAENENFYEIQINGVSCIRIYNSMGTALLDQNHPIANSALRPKWDNRSHTYRCFLTEEQMEQPELVKKTDYLYGIPFFHQETWWIFQSVSSEFSFECDEPCSYSWFDFATLTPIDNNPELNSVISP